MPEKVQTIEQFEREAKKVIVDIKTIFAKEFNVKATETIKSLFKSKNFKAKIQGGKKVGKFLPEVTKIFKEISEFTKITKKQANVYIAEYNESLGAGGNPTGVDAIKFKIANIATGNDTDLLGTEAFIQDLKTVLSGEKGNLKDSVLARQLQLDDLIVAASASLTEQGADLTRDTTKLGSKARSIRNNIKSFRQGWMHPYYDMVDVLFGDTNNKLVEQLRVGDEIRTGREISSKMAAEFNAAYIDSYGLETFSDAIKKTAEDAKAGKLYNETYLKNGETPDRLTLSVAQGRKLWMEYQDPTLRESLERQYGEADVPNTTLNKVFTSLSNQDKAFAEEQFKVYRKFYDQVNEVYKKVYYTDLGFNEWYSPIRRERDSAIKTSETLGESFHRESVARGAIKERVENTLDLKVQSDVVAYNTHIKEMSHFIAFAQKVQEIEAVFGDARIQKKLRDVKGVAMLHTMQTLREGIIRGGVQRNSGLTEKAVNFLNRGFAAEVLGGKTALTAKQLTSFIAYADEISTVDFAAGVADFWRNPAEAMRILGNTPLMKTRGVSIDAEIAQMGNNFDFELMRKKVKIDNWMMAPIKWGDRGAIYQGGWAYYKAQRKKGLSHEDALKAFESFTDKTQQSSAVDQMTALQLGSSFGRTFSMFLTAPLGYLRAEARAIRHYARGDLSAYQLGRKLALYHVAIPLFFQYVASGFDLDEDEAIRAAVLGNFNGIFILNDLITNTYDEVFGDGGYGIDGTPKYLEFIKLMYTGVSSILDSDGDIDELIDGIKDLSRGVGKVVGAPTSEAVSIYDAIYDDDLEGSDKLKRGVGWPKGALK